MQGDSLASVQGIHSLAPLEVALFAMLRVCPGAAREPEC